MWLIDTTLIELRLHTRPPPQSYAILSHTWREEEEVSFQEFNDIETRSKKKGFIKISAVCKLARLRGLKWCWVDTCCIDKTSSAELSEAINSMFRWYKESAVCFAYLRDLLPEALEERTSSLDQELANCAWFRRGWTLQELIAPSSLEFYDRDWNLRGSKAELVDILHRITGVSTRVLKNSDHLRETPVGTRMSWAADRQTKRVEDIAYCLLGIFDIYMPLIYGESERAFIRLQEEIIQVNHDLSIFAWKAEPNGQRFRGLLAQSPSEFRHCRDARLSYHLNVNTDYSITNRGIQFDTGLGRDSDGNYLLLLGCTLRDEGNSNSMDRGIENNKGSVGVYLKRTPKYELVRANPDKLHTDTGRTNPITPQHASMRIHIARNLSTYDSLTLEEQLRLSIWIGSSSLSFYIESAGPGDAWDAHSQMFTTMADHSFTGYCRLRIPAQSQSSQEYILICGLVQTPSTEMNSVRVNDEGFHVRPWCHIISQSSNMWSAFSDLTKGYGAQDLLHLRNMVDRNFGLNKRPLGKYTPGTTSGTVLVLAWAEREKNHGLWSFRIQLSMDTLKKGLPFRKPGLSSKWKNFRV
ncbi:hypothetical protein ANO14919_113390 [Xylariales sp. No.14919]|nr:hypothetical protein ANO14919_113390 [Xylariales sp. No.14919]